MKTKNIIMGMMTAVVLWCSSIAIYAIIDLSHREAVEKVHDKNCRSCAIIVKEMKARNVTPLALR